jgi:DNA-binding CsgD family transcriptional regulator
MPKRKQPGIFTPRIIEVLDYSSRDLPVKLVADKMGIKPGGVRSHLRIGREISGLHLLCALFRKAVEDGNIVLKIKQGEAHHQPYTT